MQKVAVGACCALVVGGGAVAVPEIAVHARHVPQVAAVVPQPVVPERAASHPKRKRARAVVPAAHRRPGPIYASAPATPVTTVTAVAKAKAKAKVAARPGHQRPG